MAPCGVCKKGLGIKAGVKRCRNGAICPSCAKKLPYYIKTENLRIEAVSSLISKDAFVKSKISGTFAPTSTYGDLSVDSLNGVLRIGRSASSGSDAFFIEVSNIKEIVFSADYIAGAQGRATANVYLSMSLKEPDIDIVKILVRPSDVCFLKKDGGYTLPYGATLIADEIERARARARDKHDELAVDDIMSKEQVHYLKAKALYMLGEGYTKKDVELTRLALLEAFRGKGKEGEIEAAKTLLLSLLGDENGN